MSRREPDRDVPGKAVDVVDVVVVPLVAVVDVVLLPPLFLLLAPWLSAELSSSMRAASWPRREAILLGWSERRVERWSGSERGGEGSEEEGEGS